MLEYVPAPQDAHREAPRLEYLPAPQSVHAALPAAVLCFPASHAVHVPPSGPVNPRLQRQAAEEVSAVEECPEFARHCVQA